MDVPLSCNLNPIVTQLPQIAHPLLPHACRFCMNLPPSCNPNPIATQLPQISHPLPPHAYQFCMDLPLSCNPNPIVTLIATNCPKNSSLILHGPPSKLQSKPPPHSIATNPRPELQRQQRTHNFKPPDH